MIFVSIRFPEEMPLFKASRRALVAAMFAGGWGKERSSRAAFIRHGQNRAEESDIWGPDTS